MSANIIAYEFSETDLKIIEILKQDGRTSNQQIANHLGVTTSVVSTRIRKMEDAKAMKIVAVSDFSAFDYEVLLAIGVDVAGRDPHAVAEDLAKVPAVTSVQLVTGRHDIELLVALRSMNEMSDLLLNQISQVNGVKSLDPSVTVDILKFKFDVAPIS